MNPRSATVAALAAAGVALAGCGDDAAAPACGECGAPAVAVTDDAVWAVLGSTLFRLDPATGRIEGSVHTARGTYLSTVAATPAATWVATSGRLYELPRGADRLRRVPLNGVFPDPQPSGSITLATAGTRTFLMRGRNVVSLSPTATPRVVHRTPAPGAFLVTRGATVWAGDRSGTLRRLDPATGATSGPGLRLGRDVAAIAAVADGFWALAYRYTPGSPPPVAERGAVPFHVATAAGRVDLRAGIRYDTLVTDGTGRVWAQTPTHEVVARLDVRTGAELGRTAAPAPECYELTATSDALYMGCTHTWVGVVRLDPETLLVVWRTALTVG